MKIDKRFIDDNSRDLNGKRITLAAIFLAHGLNTNVIVQGIESETELQFLNAKHSYFINNDIKVNFFSYYILGVKKCQE